MSEWLRSGASGKPGMKLRPITLKEAKEFIKLNHRHHSPTVGWKFGVGLEKEGVLVGVAVAGRPVARKLDNGKTLEVTRLATDGSKNACSKALFRNRARRSGFGIRNTDYVYLRI